MSEITNPPMEGDPLAPSSAGIVNPPLGTDAVAGAATSGAITNPSLGDDSGAAPEAMTNPVLAPLPVASDSYPANPALDDPIGDVELRFDAAIDQSAGAAKTHPPLEEDRPPPTAKKRPTANRSKKN